MKVYTVHAPAERGPEEDEYLDSFIFVREGFRWWAFLLPPIWLLVNRLWWELLGYVIVVGGLSALLGYFGGAEYSWPLMLGLNVLLAFEADTLKRWKLRRQGWRTVGVAAGRDELEAEKSFFSRFFEGAAALRGEMTRPPREMVGLFPEPGR